MKKYNLDYLTWYDFENLSRDIVEVRESMSLEAFSDGPDGGIDFRRIYAKEHSLIVQSKHYKTYKSLFSKLKFEELPKVKKLNPSRYILVTSVNMKPDQKQAIVDLFNPYIKNPIDIICGKDIEQAIDNHDAILKKNYKLWLTSTSVLQMILQRKIIGRSNQLETEIKNKTKIYVETGNVEKTLKILNENNYVMISGAPGMGKTTLAQIASLYHVKEGYELAYVTNIDEAEDIIDETQKQIIYYDDFLGKNFLKSSPYRNEDKRLVNLLNRVNSSKKTKLIMTTREYILRQAENEYDELGNLNIEVNKIVVELSSYTSFQKAHILYNHLYYSQLSKPYLKNIVDSKNYMLIINHPNYNPRLIEMMTNATILGKFKAKEFTGKFISILNTPSEIWEKAFEQHISESARFILYSLLTSPDEIKLEDLKDVFDEFVMNYTSIRGSNIGSVDFNNAIKELDDTFVTINLTKAGRCISFHNPSITDFLISYIDRDKFIQSVLIKSSLYIKPLLDNFSIKKIRNKIHIDESLSKDFVNRIANNFSNFRDVKKGDDINTINNLYKVSSFFNNDKDQAIDNMLKDKISNIKYPTNASEYDLSSYIILLSGAGLDNDEDIASITKQLITQDIYEVEELKKIQFMFDFYGYTSKQIAVDLSIDVENLFRDTISSYGIDDMDTGELETLLSDVESFESSMNYDLSEERRNIEIAMSAKNAYEPDMDDVILDGYKESHDDIGALFESLTEK